MSGEPALLPLASYGLTVVPGKIVQPIASDFPVSIRLTVAAVDPLNPVDDKEVASTLRLVRFPVKPFGDDEEDDEDEDEDSEETNEDEDEESEDGDVLTQHVVCTLAPKANVFQQTLDLIITPAEDVAFEVLGSYPVHLTGNYVQHPYDEDSDDYSDEDDEDEDELDSDEDEDELDEDDLDSDELAELETLANGDYDLTPDEDELEPKIVEVEESKPEPKAGKKAAAKEKTAAKDKTAKRAAEEPAAAEKSKKAKKDEKKVEFSEAIEKAKGATEAKFPTKKLEGGVVIEDRTVGDGPKAKRGQTVGVRYIGKLKNGKVFDKNVSGKPFNFRLGAGEVIKGWDVGVAGMAVKGERRIIIPAPMAYGRKALPGIPANSELTFDVKLVNIK